MTLVVDASVAIKWFVLEPLHEKAIAMLDQEQALHAPDFIVLELANIAWKKALRDEIDREHAHKIISVATDELITIQPFLDLLESAQAISFLLNHPVYDCIYLACATAFDTRLVTADERLIRRVAGTPYADVVTHLNEAF